MAKLRVDKIASVGVSTETTGSVFFDGAGNDSLQIANNTDFNFPGDFTIECWVYSITALGDYHNDFAHIVGKGNGVVASTYALGIYQSKINFSTSDSGGTYTARQGATTLTNNTWYHFAVTRQSNTLRLFVNGKEDHSATVSIDLTNTKSFNIGDRESGDVNANYPLNGYVSNLRICKGHAVYTSNFAVPTRELEVHEGPDDDRTVLLACYDGENIFADKTGRHIIAAYGDRTSSPTPTATDSPIGITTFQPGLDRDVDNTFGPVFQGGAGYASQNWLTLPKGTTTERNQTGGRAVYAGGYGAPAYSNTIEYVNITSTGNGKDFGDLTTAALSMAPTSSSTRGVWIGKETAVSPNVASTIDYVTIASEGNAVDFGDYIGSTIRTGGGVSSSTRGIIGGGATPTITDVIQFITFATLGNGSNFGTLTDARRDVAGAQSTTRGLFAGGLTPGISDIIDFVTIATAGNATDFGDLTAARTSLGALSSHTRAVFGAGGSPNSGSPQNNLDQVTIATLGNATDFGDLFVNRSSGTGTSNKIRGIFVGGLISPSPVTSSNTIDYITIASTGNASDFGDAIKTDRSKAAVSDSHGGL